MTDMGLLDWIFVILLILLCGAVGLLYWLFIKERNELINQFRNLHRRIDRLPGDSNNTRSIVKRVESLEANVKGILKPNNGKKQPINVNGTSFSKRDDQRVVTSYNTETSTPSDQKETKPKTDSDNDVGSRIWVKKTTDGLHRLELAEKPTDIYLSHQGNRFILHIVRLEPSNLSNIVILYGDVLDIPAGFESVKSLEMVDHPMYEEQHGSYVFISKGKIKVNQ
ncbi:MAG: hypothetical protein LHW51_13535 [Candidatus Cloacimonetes bacterium]|nr:hypothetical protein [Candidatus Cloacimonadota bacterium]